jgi:DNA-binding winged helix-turn-helix (wHTH) protein
MLHRGADGVDARRRRLELDGDRVRVGDQALDILIALAARPGELVSHNDLIDQVWPGMVADGGTLRFHITALRKALGDPALIRNVQGRGYFLAPPTDETSPGPSVVATARPGSAAAV